MSSNDLLSLVTITLAFDGEEPEVLAFTGSQLSIIASVGAAAVTTDFIEGANFNDTDERSVVIGFIDFPETDERLVVNGESYRLRDVAKFIERGIVAILERHIASLELQ
jgi:hypothetical protein